MIIAYKENNKIIFEDIFNDNTILELTDDEINIIKNDRLKNTIEILENNENVLIFKYLKIHVLYNKKYNDVCLTYKI